MIWDNVETALKLTILNQPGIARTRHHSIHEIRYVEGDACDVNAFAERSFDIVFSNAVIEHVGPALNRLRFAKEVRRLGKSYWVQTPSKWFPIESHCGLPFWWFYPNWARAYFMGRWKDKMPALARIMVGTTVLTKSELQRLFPEARIAVERFLGIPKSYTAYFEGISRSDPPEPMERIPIG